MYNFYTVSFEKDRHYLIRIIQALLFLSILFIGEGNYLLAQQPAKHINQQQPVKSISKSKFIRGMSEQGSSDLTGTETSFIKNIGQFGKTVDGCENMGEVEYGYEGFQMPVLITSRGIIFLQRKTQSPSGEEKERMERKGMTEEEISQHIKVTDRVITLEWVNANPNAEMIAEDEATGYFTYGMLNGTAHAFQKITCKDLYPGVDVEYCFTNSGKTGFEYNIILKPGADISTVKLLWGGDVKNIMSEKNGDLKIKSDIGGFLHSYPSSFYAEDNGHKIGINSRLEGNVLTFHPTEVLDKQRTVVIDPFISSTVNLTGTNTGKAKDVDFDYNGNIYVTGGGDGNVYQLAKYNASGVWQWTFNGVLTIPSWTFGTYYGGWVVEKTTGSTYLGQGFNPSTGFAIIKINTAGLYDNYITTTNFSFLEDWKMYWSCNNGSPQILIAGGGTNSNINFGICTPPSTTISSLNVTGIPYGASGWAQDIADVIIDPVTNDMYTIYGSLFGTPSLSNMIYKNTAPYSGASVAWNLYSGFVTIQEIANRPYMLGINMENSCNVFAINSSYLFYWDGKNLKAFNKATGAGVGTALTVAANTPLWCGGIIADECNNIFVGSTNGIIKVYKFNGSTFDDAADLDISVTGYSTKSVYDLAFDEAKTLLYASGDGFVASFDVSSYACPNTSYTLTTTPSCATASVTTGISPTPPAGSVVTYDLYNGNNLLNTNSTGTFTGLTPGITYTIVAIINQTCSGTSTSVDFTLPGPALTVSSTSTTCGNNTGTITASGTGGSLPYTFSKDGITFQSSGSFTGLGAGVYQVTILDASGCSTTTTVTIVNSNGPSITFTKTDALCSSSNGTITANGSGGTPPLQYSIDGSTFQSNTFFTGLAAGTYTLTVKDVTGCINNVAVTLNAIGGATLTATPAATFCNSNNGSITALAAGGTAPLQYSLDGNNFQSSNVFTGLAAGTYTVTVKDANGCISTFTCTVANSAGPAVTATTTTASCGNTNGTITATGSGGLAPLQYSINGFTFQTGNFFGGLTAGSYTVTIKDANGCTSTVNVTITTSNAPTVTATSVPAACNTSNGSVTATGSGGTLPLTYSINGFTFQSSGFFSGLAPNTYTILVKDANGCIGATTVTVNNTAGPTVSAITASASCGSNNGIITATGAGGTPPLQYSIDGSTFQSSGTFSGLATGSYMVTVKDANGCISTTNVILSNASGLSLTASSIASPCSGNLGSITAIATGGIVPLQYSIDGSTFQSSNVFTGVGAGTYTVTVSDVNGCTATASVTVGIVFAPTVTATATNANCNSNNGSITATGSGGTSPYTYSTDGSTFQSSNIFSAVTPGNYTVTVKDANGCTGTTSVTVLNVGSGSPPIITITTLKDVSCEPGDGGQIKVSVSGGTGPFTYTIDGGATFQNSQTFNIDIPGTYTIMVIDDNGCTATVTGVVGSEPGPALTATTTPSVCGSSNGSIQASGSGADPPFKYKLDNGVYQSSGTFTGLAPGTYTISVKDDEGCVTTITVTVLSTGGPTVTLTKTNATCGLINGTITATGSGGTPPLTYNINNGAFQSSGLFSGLDGGTYTVLVKDAQGCLGAATITITSGTGPSLIAVATGTSCGLVNGTIIAGGSAGTPPLTYSINGTTFQSGTTFTGLASGTYTVWVKDNNQCFSTVSVTVSNTPMPIVTAYTLSAACGNSNGSIVALGSGGASPYQYSIDGSSFQSSSTFTGVTAGAYTVTIKDANGCLNTSGVSVANLTAPSLTASSVSSTCFNPNGTITGTGTGGTPPLQYSIDGFTFQSSGSFTGVASGTYTVTVKDANGCIATKFVDVANVAGPSTLTSTVLDATCGNTNGKITASASGGTAPLQYSIDGSIFQSGTVFNSVAAGTYTLWVKDANSCTKTLSVIVVNLEGPNVTASPSPSSCFSNDGTITATATGGTGVITYSNNGGIYQADNIFTGLAAGSYTINAKDANGCIATTTVAVGTVGGPSLTAAASSSGCGDGTITASALGGLPPYQYSLDGLTFQSSNVFTCLLAGTYTVTIEDANGCISTYVVGITTILPISLLYFNAVGEKNAVDLTWSTASEINSHFFIVEKLKGEEGFEPFDTVDAAGNSLSARYYFTYDYQPVNGTNYYRLKQTDLSGDYKYSPVVSVDFVSTAVFQLYPNPAGEQVTIVTDQTIQEIRITDALGRMVYELKGNFINEISVNLSGMASGCYLFEATDIHGNTKSQMFIKSRNDGE